ncbi:MAG: hypothetical protein KDK07_25585 [Bauldia sp.]|nr:hypothetical protein [Bauldia sp.]
MTHASTRQAGRDPAATAADAAHDAALLARSLVRAIEGVAARTDAADILALAQLAETLRARVDDLAEQLHAVEDDKGTESGQATVAEIDRRDRLSNLVDKLNMCDLAVTAVVSCHGSGRRLGGVNQVLGEAAAEIRELLEEPGGER